VFDPHPSNAGLVGDPSEWEYAYLVRTSEKLSTIDHGNVPLAIGAAVALRQAELDRLKVATDALLHQIDIGDFTDSHGHLLKMNKAVLDLLRLRGEPG